MQDLKSRYSFIQDIAHSAEISRHYQDKTIQNELDVTALVNNKLHIIECKTKKYKQQSANDTLYKIDSLIDLLGGIHGRAALVNFYPITPSEALRARELDIAVFGPTELPNLSSHLEKWIQQA